MLETNATVDPAWPKFQPWSIYMKHYRVYENKKLIKKQQGKIE